MKYIFWLDLEGSVKIFKPKVKMCMPLNLVIPILAIQF